MCVLFAINHILGSSYGTGEKENLLTIPFFSFKNENHVLQSNHRAEERKNDFQLVFLCYLAVTNEITLKFWSSLNPNRKIHARTHVQNKEKKDKEYCLWCAECDIL